MINTTLVKALFTGVAILFFTIINAQAPAWSWAQIAESNTNSYNASVAFDAQNNIYATGIFDSSVTFNTTTLTSQGINFYLTKHDSQGNLLWAKTSESILLDISISSVAIDEFDNIYIMGSFTGTLILDGTTITSPFPSQTLFIAKMNALGNILWLKKIKNDDLGLYSGQIIIDPDNNPIISGAFECTSITLDNLVFTKSNGSRDSFLIKLNSEGETLWGRTLQGNSWGTNSLASDQNGSIYVFGSFYAGNFVINENIFFNNEGMDMYLAKYDSDGILLWVKQFGGNGSDLHTSISVDSSNNPIIIGDFTSSPLFFDTISISQTSTEKGFIAKFNPNGEVIWVKNNIINSGSSYSMRGMDLDNNNNIYITGISYLNQEEIFNSSLTKMDPLGNPIWTKNINGTGDNETFGIFLDSNNNIFTSGTYRNNVTFDTFNFTSNGMFNGFLAKLNQTTLNTYSPNMPLFHVYPNPTQNLLHVDTNNTNLKYNIIDIAGRIIQTGIIENDTINLSHLPSGLYILNCDIGISTKFVKE